MTKDEYNAYRREYDLKRKEQGICLKCGKPVYKGKTRCLECLRYYAERSKKYYYRKKEHDMQKAAERHEEIAQALSQCSNILKRNNLTIATNDKGQIFVLDKLTGEESEIILE